MLSYIELHALTVELIKVLEEVVIDYENLFDSELRMHEDTIACPKGREMLIRAKEKLC